jgi:prefoldin subunit 5
VAAWKARVVEKEAQANEISGNYQQLSASHDRLTQQLSQLQALVRALPHQTGDITKLNVEVLTIMDAHPFIDLLKYRATLDATTPASLHHI